MVFLLAIVWLVLVVVIPHIAILCVNTLFETSIEHSLLNWFCALLLIMIISGSASFKKE